MDNLLGLLCLFLCLAAAGWAWRINLMINHPRKYRNLRRAEREHQNRQMEVLGKGMVGGFKLLRLFMRR